MSLAILDRFDAAVGDGIERAMIHPHMRRLRRHGQLAAIAPASEGLWAQTASPPRHGTSDDFRVVVLLPHKANNGQDDTRGMLGRLVAADGEPAKVVDTAWRPIASEQPAGAPLTHHLVELTGVSRRSRRLLGPLGALVVDG